MFSETTDQIMTYDGSLGSSTHGLPMKVQIMYIISFVVFCHSENDYDKDAHFNAEWSFECNFKGNRFFAAIEIFHETATCRHCYGPCHTRIGNIFIGNRKGTGFICLGQEDFEWISPYHRKNDPGWRPGPGPLVCIYKPKTNLFLINLKKSISQKLSNRFGWKPETLHAGRLRVRTHACKITAG